MTLKRVIVLAVLAAMFASSAAVARIGYYRFPALHEDTIVFAAEGDLWVVDAEGGAARRLTTHHGEETNPAISQDGTLVAYCAHYEGPTEVYTIPIEGGVPVRRTFGSYRPQVVGWTPEGDVLYATRHLSTLPGVQLARIDLDTNESMLLPLSRASDGVIADDGTLYFTRLRFQGSRTKRYVGGTARNIWKFREDMEEAQPLTADVRTESFAPMWWKGRVYFVDGRDGSMDLWSMKPDGSDLEQHTRYEDWDIQSPSLHDGRIVFQLGAELHLFDIAQNVAKVLPITLASDFDQMRERWITKPADWLTAAHPSADGEQVVLTARGEIFVAPRKHGRLIHLTRDSGVRYRQALFTPDGESVLTLSDQSGEIEFWKMPADGLGGPEQLTEGGTIFRSGPVLSPDGRYVAYQDKNLELWLYDFEGQEHTRIARNDWESYSGLTWSPDSKWLAFVEVADNTYRQIKFYHVIEETTTEITSDRVNSASPAFTADGKWLYFLSDRNFQTLVQHPWGPYAPQPLLHNLQKVYVVSLTDEHRSPFRPDDEIQRAAKKKKKEEEDKKKEEKEKAEKETGEEEGKDEGKEEEEEDEDEELAFNLDGIKDRAIEVPVPAGNYSSLAVGEKHLFWRASNTAPPRSPRLQALKIGNEKPKVETIAEGIGGYELTLDRKKMLLRKGSDIHIADANGAKIDLAKAKVDLSRWRFPMDPTEEWRQMFIEAWRLERDYFYAPNMHGADWKAVLDRHLPLVDRVTTRGELSDLMAQMVGELSALHIFVTGGDHRAGDENVQQASLGAVLKRDAQAGGYRVDHVFKTDPDFPHERSPLDGPDSGVADGDVITHINGVATMDAGPGVLLRDQVGRQVRLRVKTGDDEPRDVIVKPVSTAAEREMRYDEWEHTRRLMVEERGDGEIGYVHLRAMGGGNYLEFARHFYPVHDRRGLIVDVRHNRGGNIDSWILGRLMREAWMYWQARVGKPTWNMQYAFRGHMVVLCDEETASDGEAFAEGFRRLGLGKVIGTRTWGGGIWLSFSNTLVDRGIASAAETGVFAPEGRWIIEMDGIEPDITVDNLPHATFNGEDAQLQAGIDHLLKLIADDPRDPAQAPPWPRRAVGEN